MPNGSQLGDLAPPAWDIWEYLETTGCHSWGQGATGIQWVELRDARCCSTYYLHRTATMAENDPAPNAGRAEVKKSYSDSTLTQ